MDTRTENINGYVYCAYCGKLLKEYSNFSICPEPSLICDCEKAKEELELYKKLKDLYNYPLADNLVEIKVNNYRNELLGIKPTIHIAI